MEMTGTFFAGRTTDDHQTGTSLDVRWKEEERKTENSMSKNS